MNSFWGWSFGVLKLLNKKKKIAGLPEIQHQLQMGQLVKWYDQVSDVTRFLMMRLDHPHYSLLVIWYIIFVNWMKKYLRYTFQTRNENNLSVRTHWTPWDQIFWPSGKLTVDMGFSYENLMWFSISEGILENTL